MLLQRIYEDDIDKFIEEETSILESNDFRFYYKCVFFEIMWHNSEVTDKVKCFFDKYLYDERYCNQIIYKSINGNINYINYLIEIGYMKEKFDNKDTRVVACNLLRSVIAKESKFIEKFIESNLHSSEEIYNSINSILSWSIEEDTDFIFKIRLELIKTYPNIVENYLNFYTLISNNLDRAIKLLITVYEIKQNNREHFNKLKIYIEKKEKIIVTQPFITIKSLINLLPKFVNIKNSNEFFEWRDNNDTEITIERVIMILLKKSVEELVKEESKNFFKIFHEYFDKGYVLYNELILYGFKFMSIDYSDKVIKCLYENFDKVIWCFRYNCTNPLSLAAEVIKKHSQHCSIENYRKIENEICYYKQFNQLECYKRRYNCNMENAKNRNKLRVYWSHWGKLQYTLLPMLYSNRRLKYTNELISVLDRASKYKNFEYNSYEVKCGSVISSISSRKEKNK